MEKDLQQIVDIQLEQVVQRLEERGLHLEVSPAARALLAQRGWDPAFGARPLKRVVQKLVVNPLSHRLLEGEILQDNTVTVDVENDEIFLKVAQAVHS